MENYPLISIVVPVYKVEEYLAKCIESIINQTYKNLEIIIVDDGSPDNCPKICDEYALKDSRIKVIHKENGGLSDARNRGIKEAKGEFIGFIDSDDYIDEDMYSYLYELIKKYNADISICGVRTFDETKDKYIAFNDEFCVDSTEALKLLANDKEMKNFAVNKLYNKGLFTDNLISYPKGKIMEDIATTYKLFEKANRIVVGNKSYYNYLIRDNSIIGSKSTKMYIAHIENVMERYEHFKDNKELGFYFYKNVFYVIMRMFIASNDETLNYIEKNNVLNDLVAEGKKYGFYNKLPLLDKARLFLLKRNKKLYSRIMLCRRKIIDI